MTVDIDTPLGALADMRPRSNLDGFENSVIQAVKARQQQAFATRLALTLTSLALLMGVGGAVLPITRVSADGPAPFGIPNSLAPSSLLLGGRR